MTSPRIISRAVIILACDLGGTRMKIGVVESGRVLAQITKPANSQAGLAPALPVLAAAWLSLLGELSLTPADCAGISMAFPSLMDRSGRILDEYGKYPDAMKLDLRAWAKAEFNLPLFIENDARLALAGEWKYGAGRGVDNLVMITLGTGVGTAAVMEGRLLRGVHGQAGVLGGHSTVNPHGHNCGCGNIGCAETEASTAWLKPAATGLPEWPASALRDLPELNYTGVFKGAAAGDPCALKLREHSLRIWSALAVNLIHAYDPELVILGGGVMASRDVILPVLTDYVHRHAHTPWGKVRLVAAELGDTAALLAGDWLWREQAMI